MGSMEEAFAAALRGMREKAAEHRQQEAAAAAQGDELAAVIAADRAAGFEGAMELLAHTERHQAR